jgi:hypothetical protein
MSARRPTVVAGSLVVAAFSAMMILPFAAVAEDGGQGSSQGGKAVDKAPAGVKATTLLPERISVNNKSQTTSFTVTVKNEGTADSGDLRMWVAGFEGMKVTDVEGCKPIAKENIPKGSNGGYSCPVGDLAPGTSKSYDVTATFDLRGKGRICLPVQTADGKKTYWQQGPVPFGTDNPSPNAPSTPLLLGTDNKPAAAGGTGDSPGAGGAAQLPRTGAGDVLAVGALGAALAAVGAAGVWWSHRRPARQRHH